MSFRVSRIERQSSRRQGLRRYGAECSSRRDNPGVDKQETESEESDNVSTRRFFYALTCHRQQDILGNLADTPSHIILSLLPDQRNWPASREDFLSAHKDGTSCLDRETVDGGAEVVLPAPVARFDLCFMQVAGASRCRRTKGSACVVPDSALSAPLAVGSAR